MNRNLSIISHLLKLIYYSIVIYYIGLTKGIITLILLSIIINYILKTHFKLEEFEHWDAIFAFMERKESFILMACAKFDKINVIQFKQMFIEKGLKKFSKLRSIKKFFFGFLFWKEQPISEAIEQINIITDVSVNNDKELRSFLDSKLKTPFNFDKHQWALDVIKNKDGSGYFIFRLDHNLSDGVGIVSFLVSMADNYDKSVFPPFKDFYFYHKLMLLPMFPFYIIKATWIMATQMITQIFHKKSPFRVEEGKDFQGKATNRFTKYYDFENFHKLSKKYKLTFSDLIFAAISKSSKDYLTSIKYDCSKINNCHQIMVTNSLRGLPHSIKDVAFDNNAFIMVCNMPLIDDTIEESYLVQEGVGNVIRNAGLIYNSKLADKVINILIGYAAHLQINRYHLRNVAMIISNVPGPIIPLKFGDSTLLEVFPYVGNACNSCFINAISYNGKFRIGVACDSAIQVDVEQFTMFIDKELEKLSYRGKTN